MNNNMARLMLLKENKVGSENLSGTKIMAKKVKKGLS